MTLVVRIKPRAQREIERAAEWWADNRPAAVGAICKDIEAALALLVEEPGIGTKIETARIFRGIHSVDTPGFGAMWVAEQYATERRSAGKPALTP